MISRWVYVVQVESQEDDDSPALTVGAAGVFRELKDAEERVKYFEHEKEFNWTWITKVWIDSARMEFDE